MQVSAPFIEMAQKTPNLPAEQRDILIDIFSARLTYIIGRFISNIILGMILGFMMGFLVNNTTNK
jgi:hypothetical protein